MRVGAEAIVFVGLGAVGVIFAFLPMPVPGRSTANVAAVDRLQIPYLAAEGVQVQLDFQQFCLIGQPDFSALNAAQQQVAAGAVKLVPGVEGGKQAALSYCTSGSGVHLGGGYILTNAHVVRALASVQQDSSVEMYGVSSSGEVAQARSVCVDPDREAGWDLAIVQLLEPLNIPAVPIAAVDAAVGEAVATVGYPIGKHGIRTTTVIQKESETLMIPEEKEEQSLDGINRLDAGLKPGDSGGGTLNAAGQLVGINSMGKGVDVSQAPSGQLAGSWMIGSGRIWQFLERVNSDRAYCRVGS